MRSALKCPNCQSGLVVYKTEPATDLTLSQNAKCSACSGRYKLVVGIEKQITSPCYPYQNKSELPVPEETERLIDLAFHFLQENKLKQEKNDLCVSHLLNNFQLSKDRAKQITQLAQASISAPNGVCLELATSSAVIIRKGISEMVVIPLSKLSEIANFNREDK